VAGTDTKQREDAVEVIHKNKQMVADFLRFLGEGDPAVLDLAVDDLTYWIAGSIPGVSGTLTKADLASAIPAMKEMFPNGVSLTPIGMTAEGTRVAVETVGRGETADGRIYANAYHQLFEIENGKVARVREYLDTQLAREFFERPWRAQ